MCERLGVCLCFVCIEPAGASLEVSVFGVVVSKFEGLSLILRVGRACSDQSATLF